MSLMSLQWVWFAKFALFILELAYTVGSAGQLKHKYHGQITNFVESDASDVKLGFYDDAWHVEYNGFAVFTLSNIDRN